MEWGRLLHKLQINPRRTFSRLIKKKYRPIFWLEFKTIVQKKSQGLLMTCFKACYDLVQKPYNSFTCIIFVRTEWLLILMGTKLTRELSPDPHTWQLSEDSTTQGRLIVSPSFLISNCCYHGDQVSVCETPAEAGLVLASRNKHTFWYSET